MLRRGGFVILAVVFLVAAGMAIAGRGPWYDEFYSFYLVRPEAPLGVLVPEWLRDNHPPLFYALAWLWARLVGLAGPGSIETLRTLNFVVLGAAVGTLAWMARTDPWLRRLLWYDTLALAAVFPALDRIDQLRSYFLSLALTALVAPQLVRQCHRDSPQRPIVLTLLLALAFSVHLITTVIVAGLVAAVFVRLVLGHRWHDARRVAVIGAVALVPFAATMAVQLPIMLGNTRTFWIPPGLNGARWAIEAEVLGVLTCNPVLSLTAVAGVALLVLQARRRDAGSREELIDMATLGAGLTLALAVLVAAHVHRPLLITRYLVAIDPILALMLALGAEHLTRRLPWRITGVIDTIMLIATCLAIHANLAATLRQWSWNGTSRAIAAQVRDCPQTVVHADLRWNSEPLGMPPRENREVVPFAYQTMARQFGFALEPAGSRAMSAACPTVFWTEHAALFHPTATEVIQHLRQAGYPVRSGRMVRRDIGWILIVPRSSR